MDQIYENRRIKLGILKKRFRHWTDLNLALGWESTSPRLSRIFVNSLKSDTQKPYVMGEVTARHIEKMLNLPLCWLDMPATYADLNDLPDPALEANKVMESIPQDKWPLALTLLKALAADQQVDTGQNEPSQSINSRKIA
jgi:hypothetical protein